jgi:hypothetical protein
MIKSGGVTGISCLVLDGTPYTAFDIPTPVGQFYESDFTIAFWMQCIMPLSNDPQYPPRNAWEILGNRTSPSHGNFLSLRMSTATGKLCFEVDEALTDSVGKNYAALTSNKSIFDNQWHHIGMTRKGNCISLYIDGILDSTATGDDTAKIANGNPLRIGQSIPYPQFLLAPMAVFDDVRIYNTSLDSGAISNIISFPLSNGNRSVDIRSFFSSQDTGVLAGLNGCYLAFDEHGILRADSKDHSSASIFTFIVDGDTLRLTVNGKNLVVDSPVASSSEALISLRSDMPGTPLLIYSSSSGDFLIGTESRQHFRNNGDRIVASTASFTLDSEFVIRLNPSVVTPPAPAEGYTDEDLALASLVWKLFAGLLLAIGVGSLVASEGRSAETGLLGLLRSRPETNTAVSQAITALKTSKGAASIASLSLGIFAAAWKAGILWTLIRFLLTTAGWLGIGKVLEKVFEYILAPEVEAAPMLAGFTVWIAQVVEAVDSYIEASTSEHHHSPDPA